MIQEPPVLITASQLAELLGISRFEVWRRTTRGDFPCIKTRAGNLYRPSDLRFFIEGRAREQRTLRELFKEYKRHMAEVAKTAPSEDAFRLLEALVQSPIAVEDEPLISGPDLPISWTDEEYNLKILEYLAHRRP